LIHFYKRIMFSRFNLSDLKTQVKTSIDEYENTQEGEDFNVWENCEYLPHGWKLKTRNSLGKYKIISSSLEEFDNFLSVFIYMSSNSEDYTEYQINQVEAKLSEEGWEKHDKLPSGWRVSKDIGDNIFVLLSKEGMLYQSLDDAQDFLKTSDKYDEVNALNLEDLCMNFVEQYVEMINIKPETPSTKILSRGTSFPCKQCGQTFRKQSKLEAHENVHKGLKPYECKECLKAFSLEENLKSHLKNHKKEVMKLYTCQVCQKPFYFLRKILEHMEDVHPDVFPYNCNLCDQNFSRSEVLRIHKKNHIKNTEVPSCDVCSKSFRTNYNLKRHKEMFH